LILLENQYRQGDVVEIAGIAGLVESINLRRTVLRDLEGKVHTIPHGEITTTSNFTKYWSRVVLDVGVAYKENMQRVFNVLNEIGMELANHPELGLKVIDPPKVLRLNSFDDSAITIRMLGVCKPLTQWELSGWMRVRIKERFDEEGIEIPFPHRTFYWGVDQAKLPWDKPADGEQPTPPAPARHVEPKPEDFVDPTTLTPEQREAMLAEMALAAQSAQEQMRRDADSVTRLPSGAENG
jgi:small conductance mechanosensitive channel